MSDIRVNELAVLSPSALDDTYNTIVFTSDGDTNQVVFEDAVAQANSNNGCVCLQEASLTIASADVLQLNSTPLTIVAAQGVGTAIEVLSASINIDFNTSAYATNTNLLIKNSTANTDQFRGGAVLESTVSTFKSLILTEPSGATDTQIIDNDALKVTVSGGNPTAGDSDITVYVTYRVITL